jgi:hypothetical protein
LLTIVKLSHLSRTDEDHQVCLSPTVSVADIVWLRLFPAIIRNYD